MTVTSAAPLAWFLLSTQAPPAAPATTHVPTTESTGTPAATSTAPTKSIESPEPMERTESTKATTPTEPTTPTDAPDSPQIPVNRKTRFAEAAAFDVVGGGSRRGAWAGTVQAGYPWQALRFQYGVHKTLTTLVEVDSALFRRTRPALGLGLRWVDRPRIRLTGDILVGWLIQTGELDRRGPNGELRLRLAFPSGRVAPYLMLATRHTLLFDRTQTVTPTGVDTSWGVRHEWTPWATLGMAIAINKNIGLEFGIDWPWIGAPTGISIPGIHAGVLFGGGR